MSGSVVVTGGSGFIGRAVIRALRAEGIPVTVVDHKPFPDSDPGVRSVLGDLADAEVRSAAVTEGSAGIVHLAATTSVLHSIDRPVEAFEVNVLLTQQLLELARQREVSRFFLASTNAVVGDTGHRVIHEELPLQPLTPYGASKAAAEALLWGYAGAYRMSNAVLRFTNVYGPGRGGKDSFVSRLMRGALAGSGVDVYGDGLQRRDLVHSADVADGIVRAWRQGFTGTAILGSGRSNTVLEIIDAVREVTAAPLPVRHVPAKTGEMPAVVVDISRARTEFGYQPSMTLVEGLATVWADFAPAQAD